MLLKFPNLKTLTLAISSGIIPQEIVVAPVLAALQSDGGIWLEADGTLPRSVSATLKDWGVVSRRGSSAVDAQFEQRSCWLHVIPFERDAAFCEVGDRTVVLFELLDETLLPEFVNEILRQGNDRQSFRHIEYEGTRRALLRVVGAPYYSLLRAVEHSSFANSARAFVERSPRIWVQAGFRHPLMDRLTPAPGQHLLLQAEGETTIAWRTLKEEPFRDVYEVTEFVLPEAREFLQSTPSNEKMHVPVRLARSGSSDSAEVFVLTNDAVRQLDSFVQSASDDVLHRLSFAVCNPAPNNTEAGQQSAGNTEGSSPTILVRIRPGRSAAPVLVFDALACREYLKIRNLFVPVGKRIHPPLRRDAIRDLLAKDESQLVWLSPLQSDSAVGYESFTPLSIDDSAFLPLTNWVDYILDRDKAAMTTWRQSHQFDFDDFICSDETTPARKKATKKPKTKGAQDSTSESKSADRADDYLIQQLVSKFRATQSAAEPEDAEVLRLKEQLQAVESAFLALDSNLEDSERLPMWRDMADLNAALGRYADSSICRQHQLWEQDSPDIDLLETWFRTEVMSADRLTAPKLVNRHNNVTGRDLDRQLKSTKPSPAEVAQLASFVVWSAKSEEGTKLVRSELSRVQQFLEHNEPSIAVRSCWLAWVSLARLSNDVLTLARARDRILERLYQHGLTADRDLPTFLRSCGSQSGDRFRAVREKVGELHQQVRVWSNVNLGLANKLTLQYIDLIFAFAFARLGEATRATELLHSSEKELRKKPDAVHGWLFNAYSFRIKSVIDGQNAVGSLPALLLSDLQNIDRLDRYKIDRLRQHSNILEPHEKLDPYREWRRRKEDDLQRMLADLFDELDRAKLIQRIEALLKRKMTIDETASVVTTALELSPRLGEKFALEMLAKVIPLDRGLSDPVVRAGLLEKGLHMAAHYDQRGSVEECFARMTQLLESQSNADVSTLEALEGLLSRSFISLRKLGMRDEIAFLLDAMTRVVKSERKSKDIETERLRILLQLAGGWFYFGQDRGWKDIDQVRDILLSNVLVEEGHVGAKKQTDLAVAYICAVGQAPLNEAVDRLNDLFSNLTGIKDGATVNTHYSLKQLDIVEALVQTIVSDSFTMDKSSQRWMDDEEFLIRLRIHRDLLNMMN